MGLYDPKGLYIMFVKLFIDNVTAQKHVLSQQGSNCTQTTMIKNNSFAANFKQKFVK